MKVETKFTQFPEINITLLDRGEAECMIDVLNRAFSSGIFEGRDIKYRVAFSYLTSRIQEIIKLNQ